jgi:S-formylglutathione hydrolase FrmB
MPSVAHERHTNPRRCRGFRTRRPGTPWLGPGLALLALLGGHDPRAHARPRTRVLAAPRHPLSSGRWLPFRQIDGAREGKRVTGRLLVYLPRGYTPSRAHRLVIALHGWGSPVNDWRAASGIAWLADRHGTVVACPEMGRTVYETSYYPGRPRLAAPTPRWPGAHWIGQVVLPYVRKHFAVGAERKHTAILGYSTGGRGAVLVAQHYPEFQLVAGLSGTYDLTLLRPGTGEHRIHEVVYGPLAAHRDRWLLDNPVSSTLLPRLKPSTVYLGHGQQDLVVPSSQTTALVTALATVGVSPELRLDPRAAHDWTYWKAELVRVFALLDRTLAPVVDALAPMASPPPIPR